MKELKFDRQTDTRFVVQCRVNREIFDKIDNIAKKNTVTVSQVVRRILEDYFDN